MYWPVQIGGIVVGVVILYLLSCIRVLNEYQRGVIFRLGRVLPQPKGPGLLMVFWPIDALVRVSLRTLVQDVPTQDVITRDNVSVQVNAVVYFRVIDPLRCILEVQHYMYATSQLSQTTLRSIVGQAELDELLSERDKINQQLQEVLDEHTDPWGVKVQLVEVKQVDLPEHMKRAMAKQAESERERRAMVIHAEGEFAAASRLREAAKLIQQYPMAMQMRFLETLIEVGADKNSTIVFPLPLELASAFLRGAPTGNGKPRSDAPEPEHLDAPTTRSR